jgi:hypothetical protein
MITQRATFQARSLGRGEARVFAEKLVATSIEPD